jgi:hypothetical protein
MNLFLGGEDLMRMCTELREGNPVTIFSVATVSARQIIFTLDGLQGIAEKYWCADVGLGPFGGERAPNLRSERDKIQHVNCS